MPHKFSLGQLYFTRGVLDTFGNSGAVFVGLARHAAGDWGEVWEEDRHLNEAALIDGERLLSIYAAEDGTRFWIITEADRSATTVLLPDEY
jgi:hypothetical protein